MRRRPYWSVLFCGVLLLCMAGAGYARQEALLAISKGEMPNDTGSDGQSTYRLVIGRELGGKMLQVVFAAHDSVGVQQARWTNWTPFTKLRFSAFNPNTHDVHFTLTIKHQQTINYDTRVDIPFVLTPGNNTFTYPLSALKNTNGSTPALGDVTRWYIASGEEQSVTVYFGDLLLEGPDTPGGTHVGPHGDPARVARLHAAKMPAITLPVLFNTAEADTICGALEVFPPDNPWNQIVEDWPVSPDSTKIVAAIGAAKPLRYNTDMGFILIPPDQPRIEVKIDGYPDESDKGPYPLPAGVPIEGWPVGYTRDGAHPDLTLDDVQRDTLKEGGDRHALVVDPVHRMLYEFYQLQKTAAGWRATQASIFDLKSNALRPYGWTSTDAAGLPIFPAVVRYDELKRGLVEHALRFTVRRSRRAYVAPATHFASRLTDADLPRMGERFRLRKDFDLTGFSPEVRTILKGLQRYGMIVADNGLEWDISVAPDARIPVLHEELRRVKGSDFEVVVPPG